jgi:hypothetical protein
MHPEVVRDLTLSGDVILVEIELLVTDVIRH